MLLKCICPHCEATSRIKEFHVSKRVRCPHCKQPFQVTSAQVATDESLVETRFVLETNDGEAIPLDNAHSPGSASTIELSIVRLGRFHLREILGQGGFGRVYRAYDPQLDREVALKVPIFGRDDSNRVRRFLSEAKAAAKLRHPNIVPVYESGEANGQFFIAAQFVTGTTLARRIAGDPIDFREAAEWVRALADALAYAHSEAIVHRDIKPENIMLDAKNQPQIMDFGLAKRTNEDSSMTVDGSILGTPQYMSPEQARGAQNQIGPQSDQYSLGVVLYELLSGKKPFEGSSHAVVAQVLAQEPPALKTIRPSIPPDLEAICQKSMSKERKGRYADCNELSDDLTRWLLGEAVHARPITSSERLIRWCRRNPLVSSLGAGILAVILFAEVSISVALYQATQARREAETARDAAKGEVKRTKRAELRATEALAEQQRLRQEATDNLTESVKQRAKAIRLGADLSIDRGIALYERDKRFDQAIHWFARAASVEGDETDQLAKVSRTNFSACAERLHPLEMAIPLPRQAWVLQRGVNPDHVIVATLQGELYDVVLKEASVQQRVVLKSGELHCIAISPGGRYAATVGKLSRETCLWNAETGTLLQRFEEYASSGESLAFSDSGAWLAIGGQNGATRIWNIEKGKWSEANITETTAVQHLAFSADATQLITALPSGHITVWQVSDGQKLRTLESFRPTGLAVGADTIVAVRFGSANVFDLATAKVRGSVLHERAGVNATCIHPSGASFCTGSNDRSARLWSCRSLQPVGGRLEHPYLVRAVSFSNDGARVITVCGEDSGPTEVRVWRYVEQTPYREVAHLDKPVVEVAVSPDDTMVAVAQNESITLQPLLAGEVTPKILTHEILQGNTDSPNLHLMAFSHDGRQLARLAHTSKKILVWETATGTLCAGPFQFSGIYGRGVQFSPEGDVLLAYGGGSETNGLIERWDLTTGKRLQEEITLEGRIGILALQPRGKIFATGLGSPKILFWDLKTMQPVRELIRTPNSPGALCWLREGRFAAGYYNWTVDVWDYEKARTIGSPLQHADKIVYLGVTFDRQKFCSSDLRSNRIWDTATLKSLGPPVGDATGQTTVTLRPGGEELVCGYQDGSVKAWRIPIAASESAAELSLWAQEATGILLNEDGGFERLDAKQWTEVREQRRKLRAKNEH